MTKTAMDPTLHYYYTQKEFEQPKHRARMLEEGC